MEVPVNLCDCISTVASLIRNQVDFLTKDGKNYVVLIHNHIYPLGYRSNSVSSLSFIFSTWKSWFLSAQWLEQNRALPQSWCVWTSPPRIFPHSSHFGKDLYSSLAHVSACE